MCSLHYRVLGTLMRWQLLILHTPFCNTSSLLQMEQHFAANVFDKVLHSHPKLVILQLRTFEQSTNLLPALRDAIFYGRFRDDVVIILKGSLDSDIPNQFETLFNGCSSEYQAKFSWSTSGIISLDVKIAPD